VAALVRRDPQFLVVESGGERAEHRSAAQSAALVTTSVTTDEYESRVHRLAVGVEIGVRQVRETPKPDPAYLGDPLPGPDGERDLLPSRPPWPPHEQEAQARRGGEPSRERPVRTFG
jgi:hypothetical protein